jgi:hypothetical protein
VMNLFKSPATVKKQVQAERTEAAAEIARISKPVQTDAATKRLAELRAQVLEVVQGRAPVDALKLVEVRKFMTELMSSEEEDEDSSTSAHRPGVNGTRNGH